MKMIHNIAIYMIKNKEYLSDIIHYIPDAKFCSITQTNQNTLINIIDVIVKDKKIWPI